MTTLQIRLVVTLGLMLLVLCVLIVVYERGQRTERNATALTTARQVIKAERAQQAVAQATEARVDRETIQTETTLREATREIDTIRNARPVAAPIPSAGGPAVPVPDRTCDDACSRVVQLAREARAAALDAGARLQAARAGD